MNHSYHILYVHVVIPTKYRFPYLDETWSQRCYQFMMEILLEEGIIVIEINGLEDHVHLLLRLKADVNLSKLIGSLKGSTSFQLNKERAHPVKFRWARGYFVRSVAPQEVGVIRRYIRNQKFRRERKFKEWMDRHFGPSAGGGSQVGSGPPTPGQPGGDR